MKVLKRISLKNVSEYLSDKEMRNVVGGYDEGYAEGYNQGTCGVNITCGSTRIKTIRGLSMAEAKAQQAAFYHDPDALGYYSMQCMNASVNAYWCCDNCT